MKQFISHFILQSRMAVLGLAVLVACSACSGSGGATVKTTGSATLFGTLIGKDGPITEAKLTAKDATGAVVATLEIKGDSHYQLELPAQTVYPVVVTAVYPISGKMAESDHGKVKAVVTEGGHLMLDITPTSTAIVETALRMGGLTPKNIRRAARSALRRGLGRSAGAASGGGHMGH